MLPEIHPKLKELVNQDGHGTILDGCAATEAIDTSGEQLSVKGCDISSLNEDGVLNTEHLNPNNPETEKVFKNAKKEDPGFWSTIIGRVVFAKKIFKSEDCESQREQNLWNKLKLPFIYSIFELFDNDGHRNAEDAAAIIEHYAKRGMPVPIRYSIEGSTIKREGNVLEKTVARRIAATLRPCNRSATSELIALPEETKLFHQTLSKGERPDSFIASSEQEIYPLLAKKILDPSAGYTFSHEHHDLGGGNLMTKVNVHSPTGDHVGAATFMHQGPHLVPGSVVVDEDHQRRGIGSGMYAHAEKLTGKKIKPSTNQTPEGAALWAGNTHNPQFGQLTKDENLEKGITGALAGMALAASPMAHKPAAPKPTTMQVQPAKAPTTAQAPKWTPDGLHNELYPIAFLESSFGKNTKHEPNSHGEYHSAIGAVGLKISSAHEVYKKAKDLQKQFPNLVDENAFTEKIKSDPKFYNTVASHYWNTLRNRFKTAARTAFAWRHGWGVAAKADHDVIHADPYVQKYLQLSSEGYHGPTAEAHEAGKVAIKKTEELEKTLTLGSYDAAPGTLTGAAALAKEDVVGKKRKLDMLKAQVMAAYRDWPMDKSFKEFLKARLPDVDEKFIDKFAEMADDIKVSKLSKAEGIKLPEIKLPKNTVIYGNKCIMPGEVVLINGPFEGSKLKLLALDDNYAYVQPFKAGDQDSVQVNKLNRSVEGTHFEILQAPQVVKDKLPIFINSGKHGDPINGTAIQQELVHGIDIAGNPELDNHMHGSTEARTNGAIGWFRSASGKMAYVKPAVKYPFDAVFGHPKEYITTARREVIFHNVARDFFNLGDFVPNTAYFRHPGTGVDYSASELVPHATHVQINSSDIDANNRLLHAGDSGVLDRLAIMDAIMGHGDRHRLNYITAPQNPNIFLIDNALLFNFADHYIPAYLHDYYKLRGLNLEMQDLNHGAIEWLITLDPFTLNAVLEQNGVATSIIKECVSRLMSMQSQAIAGKTKASDILFAHQSFVNSLKPQSLEAIAEEEGLL